LKDSLTGVLVDLAVDHLFQVLCDCAALNPDPEGEQEGEGDWFFNEDEVMSNVIGGDHANNHVDLAELLMQDPRFEDADEEESGT
jgi:nucleotide-sensitive chloride channel 1A